MVNPMDAVQHDVNPEQADSATHLVSLARGLVNKLMCGVIGVLHAAQSSARTETGLEPRYKHVPEGTVSVRRGNKAHRATTHYCARQAR
jgi:hypothetical protein